jgi:hypothetical protein
MSFFKHVEVTQIEWPYIESYLHDKHYSALD